MSSQSNRIFYAVQSVQLGTAYENDNSDPTYNNVSAVQSVGVNTNFNLEPVYQLGRLELYDNFEEIPEVEITLNRVMDGKVGFYERCMGNGSLTSLSNKKTAAKLVIYPDTDSAATGVPTAECKMNPAYLSAVTFTFPTEGNFTEEVTLVSNNKVWTTGLVNASPTAPDASLGNDYILRRNSLVTEGADASTLPYGVSGGIPVGAKISNISVSMNLGREQIRELGRRTPYYRYINFPVEITTEITVVGTKGDLVGVADTESVCANPKALENKTIELKLCDGTIINLGTKNKLTSVNYTGGDTGGGNVEMTFSYQTFNDFTYTGSSAANVTTTTTTAAP